MATECIICGEHFMDIFDGDPMCLDCAERAVMKQELLDCPCDCGNKARGIICYCADPNKLPDNVYSTVEYLGDDPYMASKAGVAWSQYSVNGMTHEEYYWWVRVHHTQQRYVENTWEKENADNPRLDGMQYQHFVNEMIRSDFEREVWGMTFLGDPTEAEYDDLVTW